MKRYAFLIVFLFSLAGLFADTWTVNYLEGTVYVNRGGRWTEIFTGDRVDSGASVRIQPDSFIEIADKEGNTIIISKPGTYLLSSIIAKNKSASSWNIGDLVASKVDTMLSGSRSQTGGEAAMGGRGAEEGGDPGLVWMTDEPEPVRELVKKGEALLEAGKYEEALKYFLEISFTASGEEKETINFYIGYTHVLRGKKSLGLVYLLRVKDDPGAWYFPRLVLLKGRLLMEGLDYEAALKLFNLYLEHFPGGESAQLVLYLSSLCLLESGDTAGARAGLAKTVGLDPDSETGKTAAAVMRTLK